MRYPAQLSWAEIGCEIARSSQTTSLLCRARTADGRLPGNGCSNSHGARPVDLIITMIKWIRTSRFSPTCGVDEGGRAAVDHELEGEGHDRHACPERVARARVRVVPVSSFV